MSPIFSTFSLGARALGLTELSFSFVTSTTSGTHQFTVPASSQAGDFVIYTHCGAANGGDVTPLPNSLPSGWTSIYRNAFAGGGDDDSVFECAYKKIVSGDVNSTITVSSNSFTFLYGIMLVFRPTRSFELTVEDTNHQVGDLNPTAQTIDGTAVATLPHLLLATYFTYDNPVSTRSWTGGTPTAELNQTTSYYLKYKMFNIGDTKENITVDMGDDSTSHSRLFSAIVSLQ